MDDDTAEQSETTPEGRRRWIGLGVLAAGLALIVIDGTIVSVALSVIISDLDLDLTDGHG